MDPLDKQDLVLSSIVSKLELECAKDIGIQPVATYLQGVQKKIDSLEEALAFLRQIMRGAPSMSDELILKMNGS